MILEILIFVMIVCLIIGGLSMKGDKNDSMLSSYECGFDSVMGSRATFSYRFFLISILFLVFDVEVTLMISLPYLSSKIIQGMGLVLFLFILLVGLLYEYYNGVLVWAEMENF